MAKKAKSVNDLPSKFEEIKEKATYYAKSTNKKSKVWPHFIGMIYFLIKESQNSKIGKISKF